MAVTLVAHVASGDAAQFRMDHGHELLERSFIPLSPCDKEVRDFSN